MNKTDLQDQIRRRQNSDTQLADQWLQDQGLQPDRLNQTPIRVLLAQRQAHLLLTLHCELVSRHQREVLEAFQRAAANQRTRKRLSPKAINEVLNISSKVNRQLFKQHRRLTKTDS